MYTNIPVQIALITYHVRVKMSAEYFSRISVRINPPERTTKRIPTQSLS